MTTCRVKCGERRTAGRPQYTTRQNHHAQFHRLDFVERNQRHDRRGAVSARGDLGDTFSKPFLVALRFVVAPLHVALFLSAHCVRKNKNTTAREALLGAARMDCVPALSHNSSSEPLVTKIEWD